MANAMLPPLSRLSIDIASKRAVETEPEGQREGQRRKISELFALQSLQRLVNTLYDTVFEQQPVTVTRQGGEGTPPSEYAVLQDATFGYGDVIAKGDFRIDRQYPFEGDGSDILDAQWLFKFVARTADVVQVKLGVRVEYTGGHVFEKLEDLFAPPREVVYHVHKAKIVENKHFMPSFAGEGNAAFETTTTPARAVIPNVCQMKPKYKMQPIKNRAAAENYIAHAVIIEVLGLELSLAEKGSDAEDECGSESVDSS